MGEGAIWELHYINEAVALKKFGDGKSEQKQGTQKTLHILQWVSALPLEYVWRLRS